MIFDGCDTVTSKLTSARLFHSSGDMLKYSMSSFFAEKNMQPPLQASGPFNDTIKVVKNVKLNRQQKTCLNKEANRAFKQ
jgi:hypothetical protein